ncbi:MAG: PAS domain-containing sensor histidine kinase, partial [Tunicatimonas sp.]
MTKRKDQNHQIEEINQVLMSLAEGDFSAKISLSQQLNGIDAIAAGINMLGEELRSSVIAKDYLDSVLCGVVDMLIIFDQDFTITRVNDKTCELLNKSEAMLLGQPLESLFAKKNASFSQRLKQLAQQQEPLYNIETSLKIQRTTALPVTLSLSVLKQRDTVTGYLLIAKDLKQILLTSRALEQRNEELKTLIYKVSHDLQGPLASILGLFQVIEQTSCEADTLPHYLSLIKRSANKLEKSVRGLVELGTDDAHQQLTTFEVRRSVEEVIGLFDDFPDREKVAIEVKASKPLQLRSEERLFRLMVQHLLENAIKYRRTNIDNCYVHVRIRSHRRGVSLTVKDNGQGMSRHVQQRAFDMFYRGNPASQGSGLGLTIVKSNVEKLGGEVAIK